MPQPALPSRSDPSVKLTISVGLIFFTCPSSGGCTLKFLLFTIFVGILSVFYPCSKTDPWRIRTAPTSSFGSRREKAFDGICSTAQCRVKGLLPSGGGLRIVRMSPSRCFSLAALVLLVYLKQTIPANDGDIWAPPSPTTSRHSLSAWLFPLSPWIRKSQDA